MTLLVPLQFDLLADVPGLLGALILVAIVVLVGRIFLRIAWKIVVVATVVVAGLWVAGLIQGVF